MIKYFELNRSGIGGKYAEMTREQFRVAKRDPNRWFIGFGNCYLECSRSEYASHHQEREHHKYLLADRKDSKITSVSYDRGLLEGAPDPDEIPIDEMIIEAMDTEYRAKRLHETLEQLSEEEQKLLHLLFHCQKRKAEIAVELGVTHQTVNRRYHRIIGKLAEMLKDLEN